MTIATVNVYPFRCRWIAPGSVASVGRSTYAMCQRVAGENRVVSEEECQGCPRHEETDDAQVTVLE
jgi:hypothetical protein